MMEWKRIPDESLCHVWQCPQCDSVVNVGPAFYADSGTPVCSGPGCEDGDAIDMVYLYSEVYL